MTMHCAEVQRFIDAYIDGEFAAEDRAEMDHHFAECETCRAEARRQAEWKSMVRARLARPQAPHGLHLRVARALDAESVEMTGFWRRASWRFAPALVAAAVLALLIVGVQQRTSPIVEESILDHTRNLPVEVVGPNPQEVASWFQGKVDFPVRPPSFGGDARLLGGRLGHLGTRFAAYLVYSVDGGHKVSVFVFDPDEMPLEAPRRVFIANRPVYVGAERGYHVALFRNGGVGYAVATDLDEPQVIQMVSQTLR
jgi:anti-sigma factor RsiW